MSADHSAPCSQTQISHMRRITAYTPSIEEIGYFEDHVLKCTSWGAVNQVLVQTPIAFTLPNALEVSPNIRSIVASGPNMMAVQLGSYNALINLTRFTDVMADPRLHLALAWHNGILVSQSSANDRTTIQTMVNGTALPPGSRYLYAKVAQNGWIAVAAGQKEAMLVALRAQQRWMIPIGIFTSLFIIIIVIYLSKKRLSPEAELRIAVRRKEFFVHYQPILDLANGVCVGAEALVRWQRPDGSIVRPDFFVPLAEESGIITQITSQVISSVVRDLGQQLSSNRSLHIAINICAEDLKGGQFLSALSSDLQEADILSKQIWLELTERSLLDISVTRRALLEARALGHAIAIDDFGTGYSNLKYLQDLPIDALKIDKSFVSSIGTGAISSSVVGHIIEMAGSLDLHIVAEGVETEEQAAYLIERDVDFVQGWLYAKALSAEEFVAFYQSRRL